MTRLVSVSILSWLLAAAGSRAFGQQYPFLTAPGAPKNIRVLFQDSHGGLWLGGDQTALFDGSRFFLLRDYGLPNAQSFDIAEDSSGGIWIAAETGLYRFWNARVERVLEGVAISVVPADSDTVVAAMGPPGRGTPQSTSLVRIRRSGASWKGEAVVHLDSPGPLTLDHSGHLLCPWQAGGWYELRLDDVLRWKPSESLAAKQNRFSESKEGLAGPVRILRDRFGCLWVGSDAQNTYNCEGRGWLPAPFEGASVRANLSETPDGNMLLTGYSMLALGRPGSFRTVTPANGLPQVFCAIQAKDGTIWIGNADGLYRFASPFRMEYWTGRDGITNPWAVTRSGGKVYAGLDRSVAVLSQDRQHWQSIASFQSVGQVVNLTPAGDGNLLAALNPGGAVLLGKDGKILARSDPKIDYWYGLRFAKTPGGETWIGGLSLARLTREGKQLEMEFHRFETQPAGNVLDVQYEGRTHTLWACYNGGLAARNENGEWREITTADGLLVNGCWSLAALPNGGVWYGYYNTPAFALVHPLPGGGATVKQFKGASGIRDAESINFDIDRRGWLWRGGNRGLSVAGEADAEAGKWLFLDPSDGLSGTGVNSGSYFEDDDGSLWMGIDLSIFHYFPPPDLVAPAFAPRVFVSSISAENQPPAVLQSAAHLPHGTKLVAHIGSLQFDRRSALELRYRALPGPSAWRETVSLDIPLGSLSSGAHTLEIQARVFTGPWSPVSKLGFTVGVPVGLTWPFLASYFAITGLLTGGILFWRRQSADEAALPDLSAWRLGALLPEVHEVAGTLLDSRFEVGELLARGGFANIMDGFDRVRQVRCAIKIFRAEIKDKDWIQRRFNQEVTALQRIRHPNVVSIYAHGVTPSGANYLVMEFIEGANLREVLENGGLTPARAALLLAQLASALDAIHAEGIFHRDVKPENVIVRNGNAAGEEAFLIDFSIAIVKDANEMLYGLTRAAGSFEYMAPEQAVGYAEASSDIYSLAKLAIEMLTGRRLADLLPAASIDLPQRLRELLPNLGLQLSSESIEMFAAALEFDPARRPRRASDFARPLVKDLRGGKAAGI